MSRFSFLLLIMRFVRLYCMTRYARAIDSGDEDTVYDNDDAARDVEGVATEVDGYDNKDAAASVSMTAGTSSSDCSRGVDTDGAARAKRAAAGGTDEYDNNDAHRSEDEDADYYVRCLRFPTEIYTEDAIGSHTCSLDVNRAGVPTNGIRLGWSPFLPTSAHCELRLNTEGRS
jgi:hypothetical protein